MSATITHSAEWHEARRSGIGGSDAPIVAGVGLISAYKLWHIKAGLMEPDDLSNLPNVEWGLRHEDAIAKKVQDMHSDWKIRRANVMRRSKEYPWAFAHFDRLVWTPGQTRPVPLQIKTAGSAKNWGPSGSDQIPFYHYYQTQHEICVSKAPFAIEAVLIAGNDYREYIIERDQAFIEKLMEDEAAFYESVRMGIMPAPQTVDDLIHAYPAPQGSYVDEDGTLEAITRKLEAVKAKLATLEAEEAELRLLAMQMTGVHNKAIAKDRKTALFSIISSEKLSLREQKKILEIHPDLEPFATRTPVRSLRLARTKNAA